MPTETSVDSVCAWGVVFVCVASEHQGVFMSDDWKIIKSEKALSYR